MSTASKIALNKEKHPEKYCAKEGCLWRLSKDSNKIYCPRHGDK